jgi:hypothetical protein
MCRGSKNVYVHRLDFQSKNFLYAIFIVKQTAFVCEFQHNPLWKMIFFSMFPLVNMRFCGHVPNSPIIRNPKRLIPYIPKKMVFWPPKLYWAQG